jgi:hypothetical protein
VDGQAPRRGIPLVADVAPNGGDPLGTKGDTGAGPIGAGPMGDRCATRDGLGTGPSANADREVAWTESFGTVVGDRGYRLGPRAGGVASVVVAGTGRTPEAAAVTALTAGWTTAVTAGWTTAVAAPTACTMGADTGAGTTADAAVMTGGMARAAVAGTDAGLDAAWATGGNGTDGTTPMTIEAAACGGMGTVAAELGLAWSKDRHNVAPTMAKPTMSARIAYRNTRPRKNFVGGAVATSGSKGLPPSPSFTCSTVVIVPIRREKTTARRSRHPLWTTCESPAPYG